MIFKIKRLMITVSYLKFIQIFMRLYFLFRQKIRRLTGYQYPLTLYTSDPNLHFSHFLSHPMSYEKSKFRFLNISESFPEGIDWNYKEYGKLWTYNLSYFDFLLQSKLKKEFALVLMEDYVDSVLYINDGLEPFPISLRAMNWIKYMSIHGVENKKINDSLYAQYYILLDNLEYHLLGNHLLENGFSLLFGAYYFKDDKLYKVAKKILLKEMKEQILKDGAHFELSPMYHQLMLFRVLDCINLVQNNDWHNKELLCLLYNKAEIMLGWLNTITYENGDIPLLNDSTNNIAPTTEQLNQYALMLNLKFGIENSELSDSGYRKIKNEHYEMIVDVGNIGPDYIPGHAHSDTFNFELYIEGKPFIVDTGLSTYEKNERRTLERSTASHNTVELEDMDQSEVWGGFRVANRAYVIDIEEADNFIRATHNGYKKRLGALHQRKFLFENKKIKIMDTIISENEYNAIARLHFYPGFEPKIINEGIQVNNIKIKIGQKESFGGVNLRSKIQEYSYAPEFNKLIKAKMIEIPFTKKLEIEIIL